MKQLYTFFILLVWQTGFCQKEINWMGLDFSQVKIQLGIAPRMQYSKLFFQDCNDFVLSDKGFADYSKYFDFIADTGIVTKRNNKIDFSNLYNTQTGIITLDSIRLVLKEFKTSQEGTGLVVFITEIDKEIEKISFIITFFDLQTKSVFLCMNNTMKAHGVGMANHWTGPIIEFTNNLLKNLKMNDHWGTRGRDFIDNYMK